MSYEPKPLEPGTLLLFKNDDRRDEKDPSHKGHGKDLGGTDVWVSAWLNKSKDGKPYMKIRLKAKQEQRRESYTRSQEEDKRTMGGDNFF